MTTRREGTRPALERLGPWWRRLLHVVLVWLGLVLAAGVLGLRPDVAQFGAILLAIAVIGWYLADHADALRAPLWPLTDEAQALTQRGGDFRVSNLARRLEAADRHGEDRANLTRYLHAQLSTIIDERLHAKHGITIEEEPRWAEGVMPRELWEFVHGLPDPDLASPAHLDQILQRIEQW